MGARISVLFISLVSLVIVVAKMSPPRKWPLSRWAVLLIVTMILGIVAAAIVLVLAFLPSNSGKFEKLYLDIDVLISVQ